MTEQDPRPPASRAAGAPDAAESSDASTAPDLPARRRPLIERLGLALIALVFGVLFAFVGVAAFVGGQPFLGVMGLIGCLMVLWVGGLTLFRG